MDGDKGGHAIRQLMRFAAQARDRDNAAEQAARRRRAERDDGGWLHQRALLVEPPAASLDLIGIRALVQAPLAALLKLEMLHRIGDEGLIAGNAGRRQRLVQNAARGSDKRLAGQVFLVAGLLPD